MTHLMRMLAQNLYAGSMFSRPMDEDESRTRQQNEGDDFAISHLSTVVKCIQSLID